MVPRWRILALYICWISTLFTRGACQCSGSQLVVTASETPTSIETPGYSTATNYTNNLSCEWLIDTGVPGQRMLLYYIKIELDCANGNDTLNLYDGSSTSDAKLIADQCTTTADVEHISSGQYLLVTFTSDAALVDVGFQMTFVTAADTSGSGCVAEYSVNASSTPQYLTSENFPGEYDSLSACRWRIAASNSLSTVNIEVLFSNIENDPNCPYDKLIIYDGSYICENKLVSTQCPTLADAASGTNYTSTGDSVLVILTSDNSYQRYGFIIKYTENYVSDSTTSTSTSSSTSTTTSAVTSSSSSQTPTTSSGSGTNSPVYKCGDVSDSRSELNLPLMAASAVAGAATVLGMMAVIRLVSYIKVRKKMKKGAVAAQTIAPLPARPTVVAPSERTNVLSFV